MMHFIISIFFVITGIVLTFVGIYIHNTDKETCTEEVQATCTGVRIDEEKHIIGMHHMKYHNRPDTYDSVFTKVNTTEKSKKIYIATYQYSCQGQDYSYIDKNGSNVAINVGDTIILRINPNNPTKILHTGVRQLIIVGIMTVVAGAIMLLINMK